MTSHGPTYIVRMVIGGSIPGSVDPSVMARSVCTMLEIEILAWKYVTA